MARPKGGPKLGGRQKGTPNKTTALLKDAILMAAQNAGNAMNRDGMIGYLEYQAQENPGPFIALLGKVLPMQVDANVNGEIGVVFKTVYEKK